MNPYPQTKPRLHAAWQKGFDAFDPRRCQSGINPYSWGSPCRVAFLGGWSRAADVHEGLAASDVLYAVQISADGGRYRDHSCYHQLEDALRAERRLSAPKGHHLRVIRRTTQVREEIMK